MKKKNTSNNKVSFWLFDTPSKSLAEIRVRLFAIMTVVICLLIFFGAIAEQIEIYFG